MLAVAGATVKLTGPRYTAHYTSRTIFLIRDICLRTSEEVKVLVTLAQKHNPRAAVRG